ncbi:hypothetical protein [Nostoc sp. ChiQUE01b]|uniref:hypothetical protein n=1 Tax=Nostoc sp. ChiQUE01b TaxID=3075376 RepID=UPI002AD2D0A9|nr:hypothetical protein [Nostoc sp. ChiQUE01b]MDZ8258032.1 hypothetical protein [Nostoc sp. ChiQUE01b]
MPVRVEIPIRIRVDPLALLERQDDLEEALAAAVGRALKNSRDVVLAQRGGFMGVRVHSPEFNWSGNGLVNVPISTQTETEAWIAVLLAQLTQAAEIYEFTRVAESVEVTLPERIEEAIDQTRYESEPSSALMAEPSDVDQAIGIYAIPSYQDEGKKSVKLFLEGSSPSSAKLTKGQEEFIQSTVARLKKGDDSLFLTLLINTRSDTSQGTGESLNLRALKKFAQSQPTQFRKLWLKTVTDSAKRITEIERTENEIKYKHPKNEDPLDIITDAVRVAQQIPEGKSLLSERESKAKGVQRLIALVNVLIAARKQLQTYLEKSSEKTDAEILQTLSVFVEKEFPRLEGIIAVIAEKKDAQKLFYELEKDLIENIRWINYIQEKVKEIDVNIGLYRLLYADVADKLDEVEILSQARRLYLQQSAENFLPTVKLIASLQQKANDFYQDWHGKVIDQKREKLEESIKKLNEIIQNTSTSDYYGYFRSVDQPYNKRLAELKEALSQLEKEIADIAKGDRDAKTLIAIGAIEQKMFLIALRAQLLQFWYMSLQILTPVSHNNIGIDAERKGWWMPIPRKITTVSAPPAVWQPGWYERVDKLRSEIEQQYNKPNFQVLNSKFEEWNLIIKTIQGEINQAAKREFWIALGITIFATIVTFGVAAEVTAAGGGFVLVTLAEAFTFTVTTHVTQSLILDKPFDPSSFVNQLSESAVMFGAFRVLNLALFAGARAFFPGRTLTQMAIIFGTPAVLSTGVPLLITHLEQNDKDRKWTEEMSTFLIVNLVLNAAMVLFTGKQMRDSLLKLNLAEQRAVITQLQALAPEAEGLGPELRKFITSGDLTQEEFAAYQARVKKVLPEFEKLVNRLASNLFSDADLAALGLTRSHLKDLAEMAAKTSKLIGNAKYTPLPKVKGALPPPSKVIDLVATSEGTYEYNPSAPGQQPSKLTTKFKGAGYDVTDMGGGVLRLTAPKGEGSSYLLLPAAKPGEPTFGRTLLERATGWRPSAEMAEIKTALEQINPILIKTLEGEFLDETALAALELLINQRAKIQNKWGVDAVRGLAEMLRLERGITRVSVQRLFERLPSEKLSGLFEKYFNLASNPNTKSIVNLLVESGLPTSTSEFLIDACDAIRQQTHGKFKFPDNMSRRAVRGLIKFVQDNPGDYVQKLVDIPPEQRLSRLEALLIPRAGQSLGALEAMLQFHNQNVRPSLNLLHGTPSNVLQAIERLVQPKGGRFSESSVRDEFLKMLERYRQRIADLQAGKNVERNALGDRNEILAILAELEQGSEVFSVGAKSKVQIDPALFELPNGGKLINATKASPIQLDVGARKVDGRIVVGETTTGELSLPEAFKSLDPKSGEPSGSSIDHSKLNLEDASTRKFVQMIKIRAAAKFAKELVTAFQGLSGQSTAVELPEMVIQVSKASEPAKRAAEALGFKIIETGK